MTWQLHPASRFAQHAAAWDELQRRTTDTPFLESGFIGPLLEHFGQGGELLALHEGSAGLEAATIVRPRGGGQWQTFQPSQMPLGPWVAACDDDLGTRVRTLLRRLPGLALSLGVTQLDPRLQARPTAGSTLRLQDYVRTSYIDVEGTFEAYWEARGKNLRQNIRKQHNKLQAEGIVPRLDCVTEVAGVAEAIAQFGTLESAGWKAGLGTAIHPDNAQGRFYRAVLEGFCAAGRGRIERYWFGERVVSMDLCIDNGPLVVVLKTAYDESFGQFSPSSLMRHDEFRRWWSEGQCRRIEFYGKTMEWHTRWTGNERQLYHATGLRWPWVAALRSHLQGWRRRRREPGVETPGISGTR